MFIKLKKTPSETTLAPGGFHLHINIRSIVAVEEANDLQWNEATQGYDEIPATIIHSLGDRSWFVQESVDEILELLNRGAL